MNKPENVAIRAISGFANDLAEREEIAPITQMLEKGSLDVSFQDLKYNGEKIEAPSISGKMYFSKDAFMLTDASVKYDEFALNNGEIYMSKDVVYVSEQKILGGAYGADLDTIAQDFADSIFAPDESNYSLDEETFEIVMSVLTAIEQREEVSEDLKKLTEKVYKDIWEIVVTHAEITSENTNERIGGQRTNVRMVSIVIDDEALALIVEDVYNYVYDSEEILEFIEKYEYLAEPILETYDIDDSLSELYEDFLDEMGETVEDFCDDIDEYDIEDITIEIFTPKFSAKLLKLEIMYDNHSVIVIDCGEKGIKKTDKIVVEILELATATYTVNESNKNTYSSTLEIEYNETEFLQANMDIDKANGTYKLAATSKIIGEDAKLTVKGTWVTEKGNWLLNLFNPKSTTTITIDKIVLSEYDEDTTINMECTFVICTNDKMPKPISDFKTVDRIDEEDIEKWAEKLSIKPTYETEEEEYPF